MPYCSKCDLTNLFGKPDLLGIAQKQMQKENIPGAAKDLFETDRETFFSLVNRYKIENRVTFAGCGMRDTCCICGAKLIK